MAMTIIGSFASLFKGVNVGDYQALAPVYPLI